MILYALEYDVWKHEDQIGVGEFEWFPFDIQHFDCIAEASELETPIDLWRYELERR